MLARKPFAWALALNLSAILISLAFGLLYGAYEPEPFGLSSATSLIGDVSRLWLSYFALLMAFTSSWLTLMSLAGRRLSPVASVALSFLLGLLGGALLGLAWGVGVPIGYFVHPPLMSMRGPLILLALVWSIYGIVLAFFWAASGAYLGLVAWLIAWVARGRFRHNTK
jgi:hypothetical protein